MTRPRVCRRVLFAAVVAAAGLMPRVAAAQDDAFKEGMKAYDDRKWAEAAANMRKALQNNGTDSRKQIEYGGITRLIGKNKTVEYLPHFYLGQALYKQEDCAGAVDAWATAEKQGAVNANAEFVKEIQAGYIVCESTKGVLPPSKFDTLVQRTTQHYNDVRSLAQSVSNLAQQNADEFRQEQRDQYQNGSRELESARSGLTTAMRSRTQKDFDAVTAAVDRAQGIFTVVQTTMRSAIDTVDSVTREVEGLLANGDTAERQVNTWITDKKTTLSASQTTLRQDSHDLLAKARDRFGAGRTSRSVATLGEARTLATDGTRSYRQLLEELTKLDQAATAQLLQAAVSGAEQAQLLFDGLVGTLGKRVAAKPSLVDDAMTADRTAIMKEADAARRRLAREKAAGNVDGIKQATTLTLQASERLNALLNRFGPLTLRERGVTEALEEGSRQFFAGQYDQALAALSAPEALAPDAPLQLHVHLFRAAVLHAQYARSPKNDALRQQALAEVAECWKLDSTFEPDPRAFSPGFIRFFKTEHAPAAAGGQ